MKGSDRHNDGPASLASGPDLSLSFNAAFSVYVEDFVLDVIAFRVTISLNLLINRADFIWIVASVNLLLYILNGLVIFFRLHSIFSFTDQSAYTREASPVNHVTPDDAPLLLIHGDAEDVIPFQQAELMHEAVKKVRVPVKLLRVPGGTHVNLRTKDAPDYLNEMVKWHEQHLRETKSTINGGSPSTLCAPNNVMHPTPS